MKQFAQPIDLGGDLIDIVNAFLIGESLMRAADIGEHLQRLIHG
jgi:indole-3-glycerol phosphate synthase